jgi:hypothetical protein
LLREPGIPQAQYAGETLLPHERFTLTDESGRGFGESIDLVSEVAVCIRLERDEALAMIPPPEGWPRARPDRSALA